MEIRVPDLEAELAISESIKRRGSMTRELFQLRGMSVEPLTPGLVRIIAERYGQQMSDEEILVWTARKAPEPAFPQIPA